MGTLTWAPVETVTVQPEELSEGELIDISEESSHDEKEEDVLK